MALRFVAKYQIDGYEVQVPSSGPVLTIYRSMVVGDQIIKLPDCIVSGDLLVKLMDDVVHRLNKLTGMDINSGVAYYTATRDALYNVAAPPKDS